MTSGEDDYWREGTLTEVAGGADIAVDESTPLQSWDGFGGAFNEKGWQVLLMLSDADRERAMRLLFGADGANFAFGRIPIGASDYALVRYTLCEAPCDATLDAFSIERDREHLIPYIHAALAVKPDIRFWASPWTPPRWMKDNNAYDGGHMKSDGVTLDAYARYLSRFVQAYAGEGINIEAVHPQTDPGYEQTYPSCLWSADVMTEFIDTYLGPLFAQEHPNVQLWLGAMANTNVAPSIVQTVMSSTAAQYITGLGLEWDMVAYADPFFQQYSRPIMQTGHKGGNYPWVPDDYEDTAPNDHAYGVENWHLIKEWIESGVNSYMAWNMVLDNVGLSIDSGRDWAQNALLVVDPTLTTLIETPAYYVFRHFSAFIDPGARRLATSGTAVEALAFRNADGSIITVMYNPGATSRPTNLAVGGTTVQFEIPANGWATVNWEPT